MTDKKMIRVVLASTTDALTVVQYCALIDPENWEARTDMMEAGSMRSLHGEWLRMAEDMLKELLEN